MMMNHLTSSMEREKGEREGEEGGGGGRREEGRRYLTYYCRCMYQFKPVT